MGRPLLARTALSSFALLLSAWLSGCDRGSHTVIDSQQANAGGSGGSSAVTVAGTSGVITLPPFVPPCQVPDTGSAVFAERAFSNAAPARRELYTWTTSEQVVELRAGSVLLTRTERPELGPGYASEALAELAAQTPTGAPSVDDSIALAVLLSGPAFSKARYAWPEPWATRVGWPGESYGDQLVRLVLREDAWLARFDAGRLDVVDMNNAPVAAADALAQPERLAGLYFVKNAGADGPICGGSFRSGSDGYREFIIGNESMIEEWSLGTPEIAARIESDIALVQEFFDRIRPCPPRDDPHYWNLNVVCGWSSQPATTELGAYEGSLAIPSPGYVPQAMPLASLIEALEASRFELDPFVVSPP